MSRPTIDERITSAQVAIENALDHPEIASLLAEYNYDQERLYFGKGLLSEAQGLHSHQQEQYGNQYQATDDLYITWGTAKAVYSGHIRLARVALKKNRGAKKKLGLLGPRKRALSRWVTQALQFYDNALKDDFIKERLATFGLTEQKLQEGRNLVVQVLEEEKWQERKKGTAQDTTSRRNHALDKLDEWMSDFKEVARVALADHPHLLKILGFK